MIMIIIAIVIVASTSIVAIVVIVSLLLLSALDFGCSHSRIQPDGIEYCIISSGIVSHARLCTGFFPASGSVFTLLVSNIGPESDGFPFALSLRGLRSRMSCFWRFRV